MELVKFSDVRHLPKGVRHLAYFWRVFRALRNADLALALDPVSVGVPVCVAARFARKPFVVKIVGDYAWEQGQQRFGITAALDDFVKTSRVPCAVRVLRWVQTRVAAAATRIIVPSEYLKGIVRAWGIPGENIDVIYNAVPLEGAGTMPEAVATLPRPLIVTAGRLVPWKHIDGIIDAVASMSGVSLAVIGDGPERQALVRRAEEKLPGKVLFTGMLSHQDTLAALGAADIFVLNSSYEGLSHLLIEAQALGAAIVATRVGGNPEVVTDGEDGLLVPVGDTPALAQALMRLLGDEALRARLRARAAESAKRFSTEAMLASLTRFLERV